MTDVTPPTVNRMILCRALRSGDFPQTTGVLCRPNRGRPRFDVLGVATSIFRHHNPGIIDARPISHVEHGRIVRFYDLSTYRDCDLLPRIRDWYGFSTCTGNIDMLAGISLMSLNDLGRNFNFLARIIEDAPGELLS